jgi:hypothetical protein
MPLPKMFNVGEMGLDLPDDYPVCAFIKRNGFMLDVTWSKKLNQLIIGTTGTTTSEYAKLGASYITENMIPIFQEWADVTFTFEVCDPSDPHIAVEVPGLYLLAARVVDWNSDYNLMVSKYYRDEILDSFKQAGADFFFEHPQEGVTMGDIKKQCETVDHEGFVVWFNLNTDTDTRCYPLKVKSRRYVAMKKLARAKNDVISKILWSHEFEYLYKDNQALLQMLGALRQDTVFFIRMNEQERLKFMRAVLEAFDDEAMGE